MVIYEKNYSGMGNKIFQNDAFFERKLVHLTPNNLMGLVYISLSVRACIYEDAVNAIIYYPSILVCY